MGTIESENGKSFITAAVGRLGGLGVPIGPRMNLPIGNPKTLDSKSMISSAIFDSAD
jgi:hypothetical protein